MRRCCAPSCPITSNGYSCIQQRNRRSCAPSCPTTTTTIVTSFGALATQPWKCADMCIQVPLTKRTSTDKPTKGTYGARSGSELRRLMFEPGFRQWNSYIVVFACMTPSFCMSSCIVYKKEHNEHNNGQKCYWNKNEWNPYNKRTQRTKCNGNVTGLHIDQQCSNVTILVHVTFM